MDRTLKTLIVDDEPIARQILREELTQLSAVQIVGEANNGPEALRMIVDLRPDLVFLDLEMPVFSGFEVVRRLRGSRLPVIVAVTAFDQYALEAFEAGAIDYLLKPVRRERLEKAVERSRNLLGKQSETREAAPPKMVGRIGRDYFLLDLDEVLALHAEGELVWIITEKRRFLASRTLRSIEAGLSPSDFRRIHRNAIVNTNHVRQMTAIASHRWRLTLSNQQEFLVSKRQARYIRGLLRI